MANRFWVPVAGAGTGTWDATDTSHWSATTGGAGGASAPTIADVAIIDALSIPVASSITIAAGAACASCVWTPTLSAAISLTIVLAANFNAGSSLKYLGSSAAFRLFIQSSPVLTQRTLTAAFIDPASDFTDFMGINAAGAAAPFNVGTIIGDGLGNSNISFTPSATQYWRTPTTGSKQYNVAANWFLGTNGTGGAGRVPLPQDDVVFDANSIGATGTTLFMSVPRLGRSITISGVQNNPSWNIWNSATGIYGSLFCDGSVTPVGAILYSFYARTPVVITPGPLLMSAVNLIANTTYTLGGALTCSLTFGSGAVANVATCNTAGYSLTAGAVSSAAINAGTSVITITGTSFNPGSNSVLDACTIKFTDASSTIKAFTGQSKAYNIVQLSGAGSGSFDILGNNSIANLVIDNLPKNVRVTAGSTTTLGNVTVPPYNPADVKFVRFGTATATLSTPDQLALQLVDEIEIAVRYDLAVEHGTYSVLVGKTVFNVSGYRLGINASQLLLQMFRAGTSIGPQGPSGTFVDKHWVKAYFKRDTGSGQYVVRYYYSTQTVFDEASVVWTQWGADFTGASAAVVANTGSLYVGGTSEGNTCLEDIYYSRVSATAGGASLSTCKPNDWVSGNTFTSSTTGEVWTRNGQALIYPEIRIDSITAATHTLTKSGGGTVLIPKANVQRSIASPANTFYGINQSLDGGTNTNWRFGWPQLFASPGGFIIQRNDATLLKLVHLIASAGSIVVNGKPIGLLKLCRLLAQATAYSVNGKSAGLSRSFRLYAQKGSTVLQGNEIKLLKLLRMFAVSGTFDVDEQTANLIVILHLLAGTGVFETEGQNINLGHIRRWFVQMGELNTFGNLAALCKNNRLYTEIGDFILDGMDIDFIKTYSLLAENGEFIVNGHNAKFWRPFHERIIKIEAEDRTATVDAEYRVVEIPEEI